MYDVVQHGNACRTERGGGEGRGGGGGGGVERGGGGFVVETFFFFFNVKDQIQENTVSFSRYHNLSTIYIS